MGRRETMTLKKYVKEFNGAPLMDHEFAEGAAQIVDCESLAAAGKAFLAAKQELEFQLRQYEVEIG